MYKARTLAISDGFGSGLFAVLGSGKGVGEVGLGIGIVAVLTASSGILLMQRAAAGSQRASDG